MNRYYHWLWILVFIHIVFIINGITELLYDLYSVVSCPNQFLIFFQFIISYKPIDKSMAYTLMVISAIGRFYSGNVGCRLLLINYKWLLDYCYVQKITTKKGIIWVPARVLFLSYMRIAALINIKCIHLNILSYIIIYSTDESRRFKKYTIRYLYITKICL